jgi:hypothetical protein
VDPICASVDLLSPLGQQRNETVHTQALRFLLDPSAAHELGAEPVRSLLALLSRRAPEAQR